MFDNHKLCRHYFISSYDLRLYRYLLGPQMARPEMVKKVTRGGNLRKRWWQSKKRKKVELSKKTKSNMVEE